MKYGKLSGIDKRASRLVYGSNRIMYGEDAQAAAEVLDLAFANGFTVFDTANSYQNSERNIGCWMAKRANREKVILLDKGCNPGQKGKSDVMSDALLYEQTAESLRRLQTDYLDLYVLHRDDVSYPVSKIMHALNDLKQKGVIRRFGASNWTLSRIREANAFAKSHGMEGFSVVSPSFSIAETAFDPWGGSVTLCGKAHAADRKWYEENQIAVMPYSALGRGFFSGKFRTDSGLDIGACLPYAPIAEYDTPHNRRRLRAAEQIAAEKGASVSQVCLAYLLSQPMEIYPIINPSQEAHMKENIGAFDVTLTEEEKERLMCD